MTILHRHERLVLSLIAIAYLILAVGFSLGPIFEGPDEGQHYRYVHLIAHTGKLPDPTAVVRGELHQAPLYYVIVSPIVAITGDSDFEETVSAQNPWAGYLIGIAGNDNKNAHLHSRRESFPFQGSPVSRTVHLIRLVGVLIGLGTLVSIFLVAQTLWPDRPDRRLAAVGFVAFFPQFLYINSVISNDGLTILLSSLSLYLVLKQQNSVPTWKDSVLLGGVLGLALITKISALFLVFPVGLSVVMNLQRWRQTTLSLAVVVLTAGWWYARNTILYNDPANLNALFVTWPSEKISSSGPNFAIGVQQMSFAYPTFWARFGVNTVSVGESIYQFYNVLVFFVIVGLIATLMTTIHRHLVHHQSRTVFRNSAIITIFILAWIAATLYHASSAWSGNNGRYLLPAIAGWSILFAQGMDVFTPRSGRTHFAFMSVSVLGVIAAITLFRYFLPAYAILPVPAKIDHPLAYTYEDTAELIGVDRPLIRARPREITQITLYWRALRTPEQILIAHLHSLESEIIRRDSYPATGNLPATDWLPGQTWAETYNLEVPKRAEIQTVYFLTADLSEQTTSRTLIVSDENHKTVVPVVGVLAITGPVMPDESAYHFGSQIGLLEPIIRRSEDDEGICLQWQVVEEMQDDYKIFIHILSPTGDLISQVDTQPKGGRYPTWAWTQGERIEDCIPMSFPDLPSTEWHIALGIYDQSTGERLPVIDRNGNSLPDQQIVVQP